MSEPNWQAPLCSCGCGNAARCAYIQMLSQCVDCGEET